MAKINILESSVYNKIAAGEVVERPASALKELIENSIDAGSTSISIEIDEGGTKKIKVSDNGCGIEPEDIKNAFLCHATSKIKNEQDLDSIKTLGFRGEALSSIAAVSCVSLVTKTSFNETATKIVLEAGEVKSVEEMSSPVGTTIVVTNLFYNVPARIKFLKKPKYEEIDISSMVSRMILANPNISFKLIINGKIVYSTIGRGTKDAIFEVYGEEIFNNLIPVSYKSEDINIEGYIGSKKIVKSNRTFQTLIINGRYVTNFLVSSAVQNAYDSFLMKGQFPFYVLNLYLPFNSVDVNVHPNKMEVKFDNQNKIFAIFNKAVFEALSDSDFIAKPFVEDKKEENLITTEKQNSFIFPTEFLQSANAEQTRKAESNKSIENNNNLNYNKPCEKIFNTFRKPCELTEEKTDVYNINKSCENNNKNLNDFDCNKSSEINYNDLKEVSKENAKICIESFKKEENFVNENHFSSHNSSLEFNSPKIGVEEILPEVKLNNFEQQKSIQVQTKIFEDSKTCKIIGVLFDTYILVQSDEEIYLIDQHAAHERQLYDKIMSEIDSQSVVKQDMLFPYLREISAEEHNFIEENIEIFEKSGFEIDFFGKNTIRISCVPFVLKDINLDHFVSTVFSNFQTIANKPINYAIEKFTQMACKAAVKAGNVLSQIEIEVLLKKLDETKVLLCPHGRPIVVDITKKDIEKWFKRIV
ncbi:MAG: DNA mismatch repair endonuclease MutL [Clostridia bacterium]